MPSITPRLAAVLVCLLMVAGCASRPAGAPPAARSSDCSFYQRTAERMKQPDGLSSNVDPAVAWAWLSREAQQAGCSISAPAKP